ncbi:MAG TPA: DUF1549 and DUF1553 domain-containing protein [Pirellulales bacterium]|nr:DUF1549 and DUF1553 domain-containing protein [Pirellulales bacterium]
MFRANVFYRAHWLFVFGLLGLAAAAQAMAAETGSLAVNPPRVMLEDSLARRQLLVSAAGGDVTHAAVYQVANPAVARVEEGGYVVPVGPGETQITVRHGAEQVAVPLTVAAFDVGGRRIDFANDVVPLLSRYGCNAGGCHGKASGQNGFKLSLFGFDPAFDYDAIVRSARGRRVFPASPAQSLLLLKATGAVPHGGGERIEAASEPYQLLLRWIEQGLPGSAPDAPVISRLVVEPDQRVLHTGEEQQLAILAEYTDGSRRDVTRQAQYASNLDLVAAVDERGLVHCGSQTGEAAVMARYMGQVAVFRAQVPHGDRQASAGEFAIANYIDALVLAKWRQLGLAPSPGADDATFLRRVTIDLCGRLPTVTETRSFLTDTAPNKREVLVDRLLASPDYPAYFALRWSSILRNSFLAGSDQAAYAFHDWIKSMIARNRPYDEFVRGVVAAAGEWQDAPAINWFWQMRDDQLHQPTADTAQVFLGIRLQCARCHHHPYERWGQDDYFGLAGFFTRLGRKSFGQPPPYFSSSNVTTGERNPLTGQTPEPKFLAGPPAKLSPEQDPRHALVDWMAEPNNPFFAKALVNRMWGHFFGRGLVDPVDDMRDTNPPSNPELLDALAKDFIEHKFDVKHIIRTIVTTSAYQLDAAPTDGNRQDRQNYARFYARRLMAEVLLDGVDQACGTRTRFDRVASTARAIDLPHEGFGSYFLDTFDRPRRVSGCECERSVGATLGQVLLLSNSDEVEQKVASGEGVIAKLLADKKPPAEIVDELYLGTFSRFPSDAERAKALSFVSSEADPRPALEDLLWTLVNSKEFVFNH